MHTVSPPHDHGYFLCMCASCRYVCDTGNHCIRRIFPNGTVTTFAGTCGVAGLRDGPLTVALFSAPSGITLYHNVSDGNRLTLFVADTGNHRIRRIRPEPTVGVRLLLNPHPPPPPGPSSFHHPPLPNTGHFSVTCPLAQPLAQAVITLFTSCSAMNAILHTQQLALSASPYLYTIVPLLSLHASALALCMSR